MALGNQNIISITQFPLVLTARKYGALATFPYWCGAQMQKFSLTFIWLNRMCNLPSITNSCTQLKHFHNFHLKLYTLKMFVMHTKTNLKNPTCFDRFAHHHQGLVPVPCTITTCQFFCFFAFQLLTSSNCTRHGTIETCRVFKISFSTHHKHF